MQALQLAKFVISNTSFMYVRTQDTHFQVEDAEGASFFVIDNQGWLAFCLPVSEISRNLTIIILLTSFTT